jgi:hypothetical protein
VGIGATSCTYTLQQLHWSNGSVSVHSLDLQEGGGGGGAVLTGGPAHENVSQVLQRCPLGEVGVWHPLPVPGRVQSYPVLGAKPTLYSGKLLTEKFRSVE